jgi:DNA-binding NarL/FixJ family response regulator
MIIILTNYDIPEYREAAARFKADHFFSKDSMTIGVVVTLLKPMLSKERVNGDRSETNLA